ncbi:multicopper oxidase domain-containing protein [Corynebacterium uterequi]|uniref:Multicopper oxidase CueO n=1 Tax=Corynebacterium uterequi TaxID=1072256 RepID=A0A0G3HB04_9CORY|nr:multicopper oxidase domain-containing protein [Corynebacterium uterequi]AKK10561.1 putative multicopper oxidase [Corynebacterium uterequi]
MNLDRRSFLKATSVAVAAGGLSVFAAACSRGADDASSAASSAPAGPENAKGAKAAGERRPLPIPELLEGPNFSLEAREGETEILAGKSTPTWGYNASILGPTLLMKRGEKVTIDVKNSLPEMTTVHWHGMHVPAEMDGGPHSAIEPGQSWTASYEVKQEACTLWYHPHPHGKTGLHAYRGLAGLIYVEDDNAVDLPKEYGVDDIPVVIQDKRFHADGSLDEEDLPDLGLLGDTPVVNGINNPHFAATTNRVRLRLLNGSVMRLYRIALKDGSSFHQVASDGGLLAAPVERTDIILSPGERAEIVVNLASGSENMLQAIPFVQQAQDWLEALPGLGLDQTLDLLSLTGPEKDAGVGTLPASLSASAAEQPDVTGAPMRRFDLSWFLINGQQMDMNRIDDVIDHDGWEVWEVQNSDEWPHNFHVHDVQFKVIEIDENNLGVQHEGWKDTVMLFPGVKARLALRFTDYTSVDVPYMYHCHLMFHEDQGMMGQFLVTEPGAQLPAKFSSSQPRTAQGAPRYEGPGTPELPKVENEDDGDGSDGGDWSGDDHDHEHHDHH